MTLTVEAPSLFRSEEISHWPTPLPPSRGEKCGRQQIVFCGCEARAVLSRCKRLDCPGCARFLRDRRAAQIKARLDVGRAGGAVIYTIFTVPPELRERAANVKTWNGWRRRIWKWMKENLGGKFAVERTDPSGEDHVTWHPHLNFLWVQLPGHRAFIGEERLEALKAEWARVIGSERGVNVRSQYSVEERKIGFWASYLGRTWPEWRKAVPKHLTVRWLGSYPKAEKKEKATCPKCKERYRIWNMESEEEARAWAGRGPEACWRERRRRRREWIGAPA